jgi:hypothetical protein
MSNTIALTLSLTLPDIAITLGHNEMIKGGGVLSVYRLISRDFAKFPDVIGDDLPNDILG